MKVINVQEAKTHLSRLIEQVAQGEDVVLGKYGKPMARLTAYAPEREARRLGGFGGKLHIADDFDDEDPRISSLFYGTEE